MKRKLHFLKGFTGEMLRSLKESGKGKSPFTVTITHTSTAFIERPGDGYGWFGLTLRGNSKDRRRQARQLERWLNSEEN